MKLLREIFDQPYPYTKTPKEDYTNNERFHEYKFKSHKGEDYGVEIHHGREEEHDQADVSFYGSGSSSVTGNEKGHASKVFSTVHHILKQHIAANPHIKNITFSSEKRDYNRNSPDGSKIDTGRTKLYHHMANKMTGGKYQSSLDTRNGRTQFFIQTKDIK